MSEYRPWDLGKKDEPDKDPADAEEAPPEPDPKGSVKAPTEPAKEPTPEDLEQTKVAAAPGLGERIIQTKDGGRRLAAWSTLSGGGLLFFAAVFMIMGTNIGIGLLENEGDRPDAEDTRMVRNIVAPLLFIAATPALAAGFGLVYHQGWAKPLGQVVAGLQILTIVGLVHGIMTFAGLANWRRA